MIFFIAYSCSSIKKNNTAMNKKEKWNNGPISLDFKNGPPTLIYKTKKDYRKNVPVILSEDKTKIVSYPHPKDIFYKGKLAYPYELKNGYLLDNCGINVNVAFLKMTYEEYSKLENGPSLEELLNMIIDKNPLVELYYCGNRYSLKNEILDLNQLIENEKLMKCKCLIHK